MCGSMVDIQSPTAEIRRGKTKKERKRKKPQGKNIMSASATQGGHKKFERHNYGLCDSGGAEIERVDNVGVDKSARRSRGGHRESGQRSTKKQGWTTREWRSMSNNSLVPCGNARFCESCALRVAELDAGCPVCRVQITMVMRLFQ